MFLFQQWFFKYEKNLIVLAVLSLVLGCSRIDHSLFGIDLPAEKIKVLATTNEIPNANNKVLKVEYQKYLDTMLETQLVKVSELKLFQNGESYTPLLKMIENSQKYFYMNVLSFTCDSVTEKMVQLLETKSKKGVQVKLILNKGFSFLSMGCLSRLQKSGIQIVKAKTHSSYFLNDQQELMIGSQSVARMFFLSDGFNSLDRDMMLYSKGPLATDALRDFISTWSENGELANDDLKHYQDLLKSDYDNKIRGNFLYVNKEIIPDKFCRFVSERPRLGVKDIQLLWRELLSINEKELFFSGVKVEIANGELGQTLKKRSLDGVQTHYIGNGYFSGNGELTMVLDEWIKSSAFLAPQIEKIKHWDMRRLAHANQSQYDSLKENSAINIWGYFNFIHYKVWMFDNPGFFVGSANLDESEFGVVDEAGVYCLDTKLHNELKSYLQRDQRNSSFYKGTIK